MPHSSIFYLLLIEAHNQNGDIVFANVNEANINNIEYSRKQKKPQTEVRSFNYLRYFFEQYPRTPSLSFTYSKTVPLFFI